MFDIPTPALILAAVVGGWVVQSYLAYRQSQGFMGAVRVLRSKGRVSIGVGGRRYLGGRAYVAIAVDDHGKVADALTLSGLTTFARPRKVSALLGVKVNQLKGDREIPGLSSQQREAARQAATLLKAAQQEGSETPTTIPT
jgi:DNA-binding transcriptional regulator of glucitol operon